MVAPSDENGGKKIGKSISGNKNRTIHPSDLSSRLPLVLNSASPPVRLLLPVGMDLARAAFHHGSLTLW